MNQCIVEPFIFLNDSESINTVSKSKELIVISNRIKNSYKILNNNINEINAYLYANTQADEEILKILNNIKEQFDNEKKEYNKIMNEIYNFNVDS